MAEERTFFPNWFSPPGETISDVLYERRIPVDRFAANLGRTREETEKLLRGELEITVSLADSLSAVIGSSPSFWLSREKLYRSSLDRLEIYNLPTELVSWVNGLPLREMIQFEWIRKFDNISLQIAECLKFFDVTGLDVWKSKYKKTIETAAYRTSPKYQSCSSALSAWLRQGQIFSESIKCEKWNPEKFRVILPSLRKLSLVKDPQSFIPKLQLLCAEAGVAFIIVRAPSGCKASGATYFSSSKKAHIQLSCRYLTDDHFWFTFFHEAGHLLLHSQRQLFLEDVGIISREEEEANAFSESVLIPSDLKDEFLNLPLNGRKVMRFAKLAGISPGIVVGQLQHSKKLTKQQLNNLKRRYTWANGKPSLIHEKP